MEQHAIPQQITSYEFKLVGDMTLKQFIKAAVGIILALIINATKLVFFIKWPLIILSVGGGLALAFVPFQDRPLEVWLNAFLKSIYSPTIFLYKKKRPLNWLDIDLTKTIKAEEEEKEEEQRRLIPKKQKEEVKEFIESLPSVKEETRNEKLETRDEILEKKEETRNEILETKEEIENEKMPEVMAKINLDLKKQKLGATGEAVFGEIPMPDIPDVPNVLVGMVVDSNKKIVEGAIVEIQDKEGNPSRVLKTNQLGQFKTLTQMGSGKYLVVTEKEGLNFDRVEINLEGKIVEPIRITAK